MNSSCRSSTTSSPARTDTDEDRQDLETLAAALKPLSTWHALDTLQECREACGGAGFLIENRFASLRADLDVYATFEGDNTVLLQLVAKRLLADYAKEFRTVDFGVLARYVVGQATDVAIHRTGLRRRRTVRGGHRPGPEGGHRHQGRGQPAGPAH